MSSKDSDNRQIFGEIRRFFQFLGSIWGLFAGLTVFFPFINQLTGTLPFPDSSAQGPSTSLALLSSAFILLTIYLSRRLLSKLDDPNYRLSAASGYRRLPFGGYRVPLIAVLGFLFFILIFTDYLNATWAGAYEPRNLDRSLIMGVLEYALLFASATWSFGLLAASEYMKQVSKLESQRARGWPYLEAAMSAIYLRLPADEKATFRDLEILSESRSEVENRRLLSIHAKSRLSPKYREFKITIDEHQNVIDFELVRS